MVTIQYFLCILTKIKAMTASSGCNMLEWIEYHTYLGVDQFFITDDCSPDKTNLPSILRHYQGRGLVTPLWSSSRNCNSYVPNEGDTYRRMLFPPGGNAMSKCQWIMNLDYDEYVTFYHQDAGSLQQGSLARFVNTYPLPFIRLPWWVMGNYGHEKRPAGMMIDNYLTGAMTKPRYIKTIARVDDIETFSNPHFPRPRSNITSLSLKSMLSDPRLDETHPLLVGVPLHLSVGRFVEWNTLHDAERKLIAFAQRDSKSRAVVASWSREKKVKVMVPGTALFIKHFKHLSWEEYLLQRASTPTLPNGRINYWGGKDARTTWEKGNNSQIFLVATGGKGKESGGNYFDINIAESFTANMSHQLSKIIAEKKLLFASC